MIPNYCNFLTTIEMIFLEGINFSLMKINSIIFVLFNKTQPKVWNLSRSNLINFVKFLLYDHPILFLIYQIHWKSIVFCVHQWGMCYFYGYNLLSWIYIFFEKIKFQKYHNMSKILLPKKLTNLIKIIGPVAVFWNLCTHYKKQP